MKKIISFFLSFMLLSSLLLACSSDNSPTSSNLSTPSETSSQSQTATISSDVPLDTLMVGTSEMSGDFISGFGNNAFDLSIKVLTGGYAGTYEVTPSGDIVLNETFIKNLEIKDDNEANKIYTFTLHDDIFWNNGEKITAKDYVASALWYSSPEWIQIGASSAGYDSFLGFDEYFNGETDVFKGVSLISDSQFSLTISSDNFPYYWDGVNAMLSPIHFDTYLQNCEIISDENGSSFSFTSGDLLENCQRIADNERFSPTVTCGPYSFVSYENQTATLEINEYFKGDLYGNKPTIKYVVQKAIPQGTNVEWVLSGQVDLVEGVVEGEKIESAKTSSTTLYNSYARSGFGYLAMMCDVGPTADVNVRWALASLIDRSAVIDHVIGGYGSTVDAEYGVGQWMYQELAAELQSQLKPISFNVDTANAYLDETQWIYEADGVTPFDSSKAVADGSYLRHNENGEALTINHLGISENPLTDIIEIEYLKNTPLAGIKFSITRNDYSTVLQEFYYAYEIPDEDRFYNTFNLATNFSSVFDRYYNWHSDFMETQQNNGQLSDPILDELIIDMRETAPEDTDAYLDAWLAYQIRWNELMPQVPLYSNEYYDIYHNYVDNLNTSVYAGYENIICQITKSVK